MPRYFVANNKTILHPKRGAIKAGTEVTGAFGKKEMDSHIASGFVVVDYRSDAPEEAPLGGVIPSEVDTTKPEKPTRIPEVAKKPNPPVETAPSLWVLDPKTLKGKDLDALRVMILERDDTIDVDSFTSVDEAVEFLSQDFKKG